MSGHGGNQSEAHNQVVGAIRQYMAWSKAWHLKVLGGPLQRAGIPDILACWPPDGRLVAVEVKTGRGALSRGQREEMNALVRAGALVVRASTVDDLEEVLIKRGIIQVPLLVSRAQAAAWLREGGRTGAAALYLPDPEEPPTG